MVRIRIPQQKKWFFDMEMKQYTNVPLGVKAWSIKGQWKDGSLQTYHVAEVDSSILRAGIAQHKGMEKTSSVAKHHDVKLAINGGYFHVENGIPAGYIKVNNNTLYNPSYVLENTNGVIYIENGQMFFDINEKCNNEAYNIKYANALATGPMLLINGEDVPLMVDEFIDKRNPRSFIGNKADGTIVCVVIDGRQKGCEGMSLRDSRELGKELGLVNIVNLDGGGSSTLYINGEGVINHPSDTIGERAVANSIIFK